MFLIYLFKLSSVIQTNTMNDSKEAGVSGVEWGSTWTTILLTAEKISHIW